MKFVAVLLSALLSVALAKEIANPPRQAKYVNGDVHAQLRASKEASIARSRAAGLTNSTQYKAITTFTPCVNGKAGEFRCNGVDLYYFLSHAELGSNGGEGSSSWGWTKNGRDFIIIAQSDGAAFAEITKDGKLDYLGRLPSTSGTTPSIWREIRVLDHYAVIGTEITNHHIQIFDLEKLLTITAAQKPKTFSNTADITALWKGLPVGRTHNVVIDHARSYGVFVGSSPRTNKFKSGLVFVDLKNPAAPTLAGYQPDDGYVHDAQILPYKGPDANYQGRTIAYAFNEDTLTIYDVTNVANATIISRTGYTGASYTHQGWVLDPENQSFLLSDDEYDEYDKSGPGATGYPVTFIWDIRNLKAPKQTGYYRSAQYSVDHNLYVRNGTVFQSNYGAGLRIFDVSSIPSDPTGAGVKEVAFFDSYPEDDNKPNKGVIDFVGSWSSYGLFDSKWIVINNIERGAFLVKRSA